MSETDRARLPDDLGLSVDMLDVDRLRDWARLLLVHGADISQWGSVPFVASKMQTLATELEHAIRDIGTLRSALAASTQAQKEAEQRADCLLAAGPYVQGLSGDYKSGYSNGYAKGRHIEARAREDAEKTRDFLQVQLDVMRQGRDALIEQFQDDAIAFVTPFGPWFRAALSRMG